MSEKQRAKENRELTIKIEHIHAQNRNVYGSPRIHAALKSDGVKCGKNRVARLMKKAEIISVTKKKFRVTTNSKHKFPVAKNLLADFSVDRIYQVWVADITYIYTAEGWLYLASIMDLCSRKIVGYSMMTTLKTVLVLAALEMAVRRQPIPAGIIHHSDRGSQYASDDYKMAREKYGMIPSMSGKGNCFDNAAQESFHHTLKTELVYQQKYETREQAARSISDYIDNFYNHQRIHSSIGYLTPAQFESQMRTG